MTHLTLRHALLGLIFMAATLLLFCETDEALALLLLTKGVGVLLFGTGSLLLKRWRKELGIDEWLED